MFTERVPLYKINRFIHEHILPGSALVGGDDPAKPAHQRNRFRGFFHVNFGGFEGRGGRGGLEGVGGRLGHGQRDPARLTYLHRNLEAKVLKTNGNRFVIVLEFTTAILH